jgi:hypothetical protein
MDGPGSRQATRGITIVSEDKTNTDIGKHALARERKMARPMTFFDKGCFRFQSPEW